MIFSFPISNTNPGQDWSYDSLTTNSNTNQYTYRLFFSLTGCLLHHKKSFISPSSTYLLFFASSIIKNITNTYTHYQLAFLVSSIQTPILARIGHMIFISHSCVTLLLLFCHILVTLMYNFAKKSHTNSMYTSKTCIINNSAPRAPIHLISFATRRP